MHKPHGNLFIACRIGDLEAISKAVEEDPTSVNTCDKSVIVLQHGFSPLYRAVTSGSTPSVLYLLSQNADPNQLSLNNETALHQAVDASSYDLVELLLNFKANPNLQKKDGESPLHISAFKGDCKMVTLLIKHGANPNVQNPTVMITQNLRTPLHYAVNCNYIDCALAMLVEGADPYIKDIDDNDAFELAASLEIEDFLKSSCKRSSSISSFVNPFNELRVTGEATTYLISDLGDEKYSLTETQMAKHSSKPSNIELKEIYFWLEGIHLEELYEILADAGYDNSSAMVQQMKGPMPITENNLSEIGVTKAGHRKRILWRLEEDLSQGHRRHRSVSVMRCCAQIRDGTGAIVNFPDLLQVLEETGCEKFYEKFVELGYDNYELILAQFNSRYGLGKEDLSREIGIDNAKLLRRIVNRIANDVLIYKQPEIVFEEGKAGACELCIII